MTINVQRELALLERMPVKELRQKYAEVFGDATRTGNRLWLMRRIAWRIQANALGGLSERATRRAAELSNESDLRMNPPRLSGSSAGNACFRRPQRSLGPSSSVTISEFRCPARCCRPYKGRTICVRILPNGFEFEGEIYRSLSAVARVVSGTHCNGFRFFRLEREKQS